MLLLLLIGASKLLAAGRKVKGELESAETNPDAGAEVGLGLQPDDEGD
jgi:hypothetical protein